MAEARGFEPLWPGGPSAFEAAPFNRTPARFRGLGTPRENRTPTESFGDSRAATTPAGRCSWSLDSGSNGGPRDYRSRALPAELSKEIPPPTRGAKTLAVLYQLSYLARSGEGWTRTNDRGVISHVVLASIWLRENRRWTGNKRWKDLFRLRRTRSRTDTGAWPALPM